MACLICLAKTNNNQVKAFGYDKLETLGLKLIMLTN